MSRAKGIASFSANFEGQVAAPIDARFICDTQADLTQPSTWTANDGGVYVYKGMFVSVHSDPDPSKNGIYRLKSLDYTNILNWELGGSGGTNTSGLLAKTAGETLSGHRIVMESNGLVFYGNNSDPLHSNIILGLTLNAALSGGSVTVRISEEVTEPSWNWNLNQPVFLNGSQGEISQIPPTSGFSQMIGFPTSSNSLIIKIDRPIILS